MWRLRWDCFDDTDRWDGWDLWDMGLRDITLAEENLTHEIIGAFFYVYNTLHHGFLESVYARALEDVLTRLGHRAVREVRVPVWFENQVIGYHRLDMLVDDKIVIEIKATERLPDAATRQLRSYLMATHLEIGLVLHFGLKAAVHRVRPRGPLEVQSQQSTKSQ
jgi:GxxExxY protein